MSRLFPSRAADLVGPLFFYDLVRLARRGRSIFLRCAYALTLLGALCVAYVDRFAGRDVWREAFAPHMRIPRSQLVDFSRSFILAILLVQSAAVVAITPVYLAGAIAEEKERQTLALLFTAPLSDREIVLSKLFARLMHLGSLLLTGLPIALAVSWMSGGSDLAMLLSGFIVTAMNLLSVGSASMLCSVLCRNAMSALLCSYGLLVAFNLIWVVPALGFLSSPVAFVLVLDGRLSDLALPGAPRPRMTTLAPSSPTAQAILAESLPMTTVYVLVHGFIALFCIRAAIRCLRLSEPDHVFNTPAAKPRLVPVSTAFALPEEPLRPRPVRRVSLLPPSRGDPLLWKEMTHDPPKRISSAPALLKKITIQVLLFCGAFWLVVLGRRWYLKDYDETPTVIANVLLRGLSMVIAFAWCVGAAFRAASSLGRERDRRTLAMLLTLPVKRTVLLRAKWLGGILRFRTLGIFLLGVLLLSLITGAWHPLAVLLFAGSCLALLDFLASLGVWLALTCPNTRSAQLCMAALLLVLFAGPWLQLLNFHIDFSQQFLGKPYTWRLRGAPAATHR
jgi:ABC-type transport system involved in multi-copper enzyme maturation permease subunit